MSPQALTRPPERTIELPALAPREAPWLLTYATSLKGLESLEMQLGALPERTRLITHHLTRRAHDWLWDRGIEARFLPELHAKVVLYPHQQQGVVGSFNLTQRALRENIESAIPVPAKYRPGLFRDFEELWERAVPFPEERLQSSSLRYQPPELVEDEAKYLVDRLEPAEWQQEIIEQIVDWVDGDEGRAKGTVLKLPTGGGKTLVTSEAIARLLDRRPDLRVLWLAHRHELLLQAFDRVMAQVEESVSFFTERGPGTSDYQQAARKQLVFCTQQSVGKLLDFRPAPFDLVVADECHRYHRGARATYRLFEEEHRQAWGAALLGLSATPTWDRDDFKPYWRRRPVFGSGITRDFLVKKRFLARVDERSTTWETGQTFHYEESHRGGRQTELVARLAEFDTSKVNSEVYRAAVEFASLRRILVFAVGIEHARRLAAEWPVGEAEALHSQLSYAEQRRVIDRFKQRPEDGEPLRALINVEMAIEGVDVPSIDGLFLVRPTWSEVYRNQMLGRGLRGPGAGGTETCTVVDFTYQWLDAGGEIIENVGDLEFRQRNLPTPSRRRVDSGSLDAHRDAGPARHRCPDCWVPQDGGDLMRFMEHAIAKHGAGDGSSLALSLDYTPGYIWAQARPRVVRLSSPLRARIREWIALEPCDSCWAPLKGHTLAAFLSHLEDEHGVGADALARYCRVQEATLRRHARGMADLSWGIKDWLRHLRDRSQGHSGS